MEKTNSVCTIAVAPDIGARVVSFRLDQHEFIFTEPKLAGQTKSIQAPDPQFWVGGARTWMAPQDRWTMDGKGWPPPPSLDYGPWTCADVDDALVATSPIEMDPRWNCTGMRIERRVRLAPDGARAEVTHTLINASTRHQAWAPWSNVQIRATPGAAWVWFPIRAEGQYPPNGFMWYGTPGLAAGQGRPCPQLGVAALQYLRNQGKVGADSHAGWICSVEDNWAFARTWTIDPKSRFAENGNTLAIYTSGMQHLMEIENMAPLAELPPGARTEFKETWLAARVPNGPILAVTDGGIVVEKLRLSRAGDVTGAFGIFDSGKLRLRIDEKAVWEEPVQPLTPVVLSRTLNLQPELAGKDLVCESVSATGVVRLVATCRIPTR